MFCRITRGEEKIGWSWYFTETYLWAVFRYGWKLFSFCGQDGFHTIPAVLFAAFFFFFLARTLHHIAPQRLFLCYLVQSMWSRLSKRKNKRIGSLLSIIISSIWPVTCHCCTRNLTLWTLSPCNPKLSACKRVCKHQDSCMHICIFLQIRHILYKKIFQI